MQPLYVLRAAPSFYMETEGAKGLARQYAVQAETVIRRMLPVLTGGRFRVERWETGPTPRPLQDGWIMIERQDQEPSAGERWSGLEPGTSGWTAIRTAATSMP